MSGTRETRTTSAKPLPPEPMSGMAVVDEMFRSRRVERGDGSHRPLDVYIPWAEGDLLYRLVRATRPETTLEVGLANGISALFIAEALRENGSGHHIAIDPFQTSDWGDAGLVAIRQAGLDPLVTIDRRMSHHTLPDLESRGQRIQFAFIDGSHLFDYVLADLLNVDRLLDADGLIAFDDADYPAVEAVIRFALANRHYEIYPTEPVIEPSPYRPSPLVRLARRIGSAVPAIRRRCRPDFLRPAHELGILGRFVVLRKVSEDDRNDQSRHFVPF